MTEDNVVKFPGDYFAEIEPEKVLRAAIAENLKTVILIGEEQSGKPYLASSLGNLVDMNWMVDLAKADLVERGRAIDNEIVLETAKAGIVIDWPKKMKKKKKPTKKPRPKRK